MPWCPTCLSEYRETVELCPECNVALVEKLPEPKEEVDDADLLDSGAELIVAVRADFPTCLEIRAELKRSGIPCAIVHEAAPPEEPGAPRAYDLLVEVSRIDEVTRLLQERWHSVLAKEGLSPVAVGGEDELQCPACGFVLKTEVTECPDCGLALAR